jgi:hypothetical protein
MFQSYLAFEQQTQSVADVLREVNKTNSQIEYLSRQLIASFGNQIVKAKIKAYDLIIQSRLAKYLVDWGIKPNPSMIVQHETLDSVCNNQIKIEPEEDEDQVYAYTYGGPPYRGSSYHIKMLRELYSDTRTQLLLLLEKEGVTSEDIMGDT